MITVEYSVGDLRFTVTAPTPAQAAETLVLLEAAHATPAEPPKKFCGVGTGPRCGACRAAGNFNVCGKEMQ